MKLEYTQADPSDIMPVFRMARELIDTYEDFSSIDYQKVISWVERKIAEDIHEYVCVWYQGEKAAYYRLHPDGDQTELDDLYVLPHFRNRGIGCTILQKCLEEASAPVFLYVFTRNVKAISLYSRFGFRTVRQVGKTRQIMEWFPG